MLASQAGLAYAQDTSAPAVDTSAPTVTVDATATATSSATTISADPTASDQAELASLKLREQNPETSFFVKFILGFKIRQLENQLNIKKALN